MKVSFNCLSLDAVTQSQFSFIVELVAKVYDDLRQRGGFPECQVEVLLSDQFVDDVKKHMKPLANSEEADFTPDRVGGVVVAKNLAQEDDHSRVLIVFDASLWAGGATLENLLTIAHELAHPIIERARHASGSLDGVPSPSTTGGEVARAMSRIMAGEYWADRLACAALRGLAAAKVIDLPDTESYWTVVEDRYRAQLYDVCQAAHPSWPDLVQSYRMGEIDLTTLWVTIAAAIDQTLTLLVHAQALADDAQGPDLLSTPELSSLPAVILYLCHWAEYLRVVRDRPLCSSFERFESLDREIVMAGESVTMRIWRCLGLTIEERENREWALWVSEPQR